ncbi:MAG: helix-turn-helix domain-containing protein [Alphaproteobacteria bacterium]|mgnify:CR=1 FL=1
MNAKLTVSVDEAAQLLGINRVTVYRLARQKDFPAVFVGRRILIPKRGLEEWLEQESRRAVGE